MKKITVIIFSLIALLAIAGCRSRVNQLPSHLRPGSPDYLVNEGIIALNADMLPEAEKNFLRAVKKKPDLVSALYGLGIVYISMGNIDKAEVYFKKALQFSPDSADAHNYLGIIYTEKGQYEPAKENLLIAANSGTYSTPENAYANLAMLEIRHNKFDSAKRYIERGIEKNKQFPPLLNAYGIVLENEGRLTEAIFYYDRALSTLGKDDVSYLINLGRVYSKTGRKEQALDILEKALSRAPTDEVREQVRNMIKDLGKK
jgi:Tfp pilus assembly protein PilF